MAIDTITSTPQASTDASNPGYRVEGDKVVNDEFLDGFTFWDALDVINPLQHIPIVSTIYREVTGDEIKSGPRLAGGILFGGIGGLAGAAVNVFSKELTGKDLGEHAMAMVDMMVNGEEEVRTAQVDTPAGRAESAMGLDPNAPLDLLPAKWRMGGDGGGASHLAAASLTNAATEGTAPAVKPLGYDALMPLATSGSPNGLPSEPIPGSVDLILAQEARATPATIAGATSSGQAPVNQPLGYDALNPTQMAAATPSPGQSTATQQVAAATGETRPPQSLSETREFAGKTLADYRNRPVRFNAGRSSGHQAVARSTATNAATSAQPDPAAMAQLLEAQANSRGAAVEAALDSASETTAVGDVLRVPEASGAARQATGASRSTTTASASASPSSTASLTDTEAASEATQAPGAVQPDAWFAHKMLMGLEKYQKAHGGVPLMGGTDINA